MFESLHDYEESMATVVFDDRGFLAFLPNESGSIANSVSQFTGLRLCMRHIDFQNREAMYLSRFSNIVDKFPKWKEERLPPPRVSQSEVLSQWS
jgi:hypothetical protein